MEISKFSEEFVRTLIQFIKYSYCFTKESFSFIIVGEYILLSEVRKNDNDRNKQTHL